MFSGLTVPTPRYEYNQLMYRLDMADPRLSLPAPVFRQTHDETERLATGPKAAKSNQGVAFFAMTSGVDGAIPIFASYDEQGVTSLTLEMPAGAGQARPFFYALPADLESHPKHVEPLYEWSSADGKRRAYSTAKKLPDDKKEMQRADKPLCLVWRSPFAETAIAWE
jgi:hypothetical protein